MGHSHRPGISVLSGRSAIDLVALNGRLARPDLVCGHIGDPLSGEVLSINEALEDSPELVNNAPYTEGWMMEIKASDPSAFDQLMDRVAYLDMLKGSEE